MALTCGFLHGILSCLQHFLFETAVNSQLPCSTVDRQLTGSHPPHRMRQWLSFFSPRRLGELRMRHSDSAERFCVVFLIYLLSRIVPLTTYVQWSKESVGLRQPLSGISA